MAGSPRKAVPPPPRRCSRPVIPSLTAIVAGNDKMALGALHYLHRKGIDVPGRVSVVGFDDLQQSAYVRPSLTTVHLPLYEAGALACERLIERIHGTVDRVSEVLKTHLVVRRVDGDGTEVAWAFQTLAPKNQMRMLNVER